LSKKLGGVAKKYGLGKEWEHYNNLSSQFHKYYSKIADEHRRRQGRRASRKRSKQIQRSDRPVRQNMSKYGLNPKDIEEYSKLAGRWRRENMSVGRGSLFRMAYGSKGGVPVMLAARTAGLGYGYLRWERVLCLAI